MKVPVRVIPQQAVIRKIIEVTDAHSVLVSTRSVLTAAIAAMKVDSAQKVSEWLFSRIMVSIAKVVISSVVVISLVSRAVMVVLRVVATTTTVADIRIVHRVVIVLVSTTMMKRVAISLVSRAVMVVHRVVATTTTVAVISLVSRAVMVVHRAVATTTTVADMVVHQGGGYNNRGGYGRPQGGGYNNRGGYGRPHTPGYDPNAKYNLKKRIEYKEENIDPNEPLRLNKFLANAGICSRREADEFIQAGVVTVNGEVVTELGTKILRTDEVKFHDAPVSLEKKVYVLLNKPKDYVTTSDDPQQRKTVMDLVKDVCPERIYPVGRLDRNTTGVLLLTNDGDLASKLTHPKFLKKKVYHVHLDRNVTAHDLQQIRDGITLEDGEIKADAVEYADDNDKAQVGIEIHSGKNRIIRRIFESLGYRVTKLDRVQFAGLTKKNLRRGDWRFLTEKEVDMLRMGAFE